MEGLPDRLSDLVWGVVGLAAWLAAWAAETFGDWFTGLFGLGIWIAVVAGIVGNNLLHVLHRMTTSLIAIHAELNAIGETLEQSSTELTEIHRTLETASAD